MAEDGGRLTALSFMRFSTQAHSRALVLSSMGKGVSMAVIRKPSERADKSSLGLKDFERLYA